MNFSTVHTHFQGVISLVSQVIHFHAVPGVGCQLRAAPPLALFRCNVIAGDMVGTENAFDLTHTDLIVGIEGFLDPEEVFVVIASHIAEGNAEVHVRTGVEALGIGRQFAHELCRCGAAFEVDRLGAGVGFGAIDEGVLCAGGGVAVVGHPADKVLPAGRLGIGGTAFEVIGEEYTATVHGGGSAVAAHAAANYGYRAAGA